MQISFEEILHIICYKNSNILNMMIMEKPNLLDTSLNFILKKKKKIITFENKLKCFYK